MIRIHDVDPRPYGFTCHGSSRSLLKSTIPLAGICRKRCGQSEVPHCVWPPPDPLFPNQGSRQVRSGPESQRGPGCPNLGQASVICVIGRDRKARLKPIRQEMDQRFGRKSFRLAIGRARPTLTLPERSGSVRSRRAPEWSPPDRSEELCLRESHPRWTNDTWDSRAHGHSRTRGGRH